MNLPLSLKKLIFLFLIFFGIQLNPSDAQTPLEGATATSTIFIFIRHAEKAETKSGLSPKGIERASVKLPLFLKKLHLSPTLIYSSTVLRAQSTKSFFIKNFYTPNTLPQTINYNPSQWKTLIKPFQSIEHQTVLVIGHTDTTPALVNEEIKERKYSNLKENEFNHIWIIERQDSGKIIENHLSY